MKFTKLSSTAAAIIGCLFIFSACANMTPTQQRTTTGAMGGAAGGALIGALAGNAGMGAAIGAGVGALGGYGYSKHRESVDRAYQQGRQDASRGY